MSAFVVCDHESLSWIYFHLFFHYIIILTPKVACKILICMNKDPFFGQPACQRGKSADGHFKFGPNWRQTLSLLVLFCFFHMGPREQHFCFLHTLKPACNTNNTTRHHWAQTACQCLIKSIHTPADGIYNHSIVCSAPRRCASQGIKCAAHMLCTQALNTVAHAVHAASAKRLKARERAPPLPFLAKYQLSAFVLSCCHAFKRYTF